MPLRAEGVIANPPLDAGCFRPPPDDAVSVLLEEGIGCKLTGLAAGTAEDLERPPRRDRRPMRTY
jgi:hypothetical protein